MNHHVHGDALDFIYFISHLLQYPKQHFFTHLFYRSPRYTQALYKHKFISERERVARASVAVFQREVKLKNFLSSVFLKTLSGSDVKK